MLKARQLTTARVKRQIRAAAIGERARHDIDVGSPRDALIRDRVQAR